MSKGFYSAKPPGSFKQASAYRPDKATPSEAQSIRGKQRWRKLSLRVRTEEPWCSDPFGLHAKQGQPKPSKAVHHIIAIEEAPEHAHNRDNLAALCTSCHNTIEAKERTGDDTAALFHVKRSRSTGQRGAGQITFFDRSATPTRSAKKNETNF